MVLKRLFGAARGKADRRKAFRVEVPGLVAKVTGKNVVFHVRDISALGIGLADAGVMVRPQMLLELTLFKGAAMVVCGVKVRIVWTHGPAAGGRFEDVTDEQADTLHALALAEQKKAADVKKKAREKDEG
jgi:hypothetical protein